MEKNKVTKELKSLIQLDFDAIQAYEQAIDHIESNVIARKLEEFKMDHEHHINDLSAALRQHGEVPPERSRDTKGFIIEGMTAVMSVTGTKGALMAMKSNEKTINKKYDQALDMHMSDDLRMIVEKNREDERRHLSYIEHALEKETWKHEETSRAAKRSADHGDEVRP